MQRCFAYIQNVGVQGDDQGFWFEVDVEAVGRGVDGFTSTFMTGLEHLPRMMTMLGVYSLAELPGQIVRIEIDDAKFVVAMAGPLDQSWIPWDGEQQGGPTPDKGELRQ